MAAYRVGLTGGLASGKSTVARRLEEAGFRVIDADRLVADLYRPGEAGAAAVADLFGREFLAADGAVDKARLAVRIFSDPEARSRLESRIHPLVRRRFAELAQDAPGVIVLEATLLVEAGWADDFDLVVAVEADQAKQIERALKRGLPLQSARARLSAQASNSIRRRASNVRIFNSDDLAALDAQVARLVDYVRDLSRRKTNP